MILGQWKKIINKDEIAFLLECRSCPQTPVFLDIITMPTAVEVEKKIFFKRFNKFYSPLALNPLIHNEHMNTI